MIINNKEKTMKAILLTVLFLTTTLAAASMQFFNSSGTELGQFSRFSCGSGITCSQSSGKLAMSFSSSLSGALTLSNGEIINNTVDDTVEVISNDEVTTLQVTGFEAKAAILNLYADQGDDNADKYSLTSDTSNNFILKNNTTALLTVSSTGVQTFPDSETFTNASDVISFGFDDAAAEVKLVGFEATDSSLTLQADESDDNGDDWKINSIASGNTFTISNDTSGSQVAKLTMAASDGDITLTGGITGDGGDSLGGFLRPQVASTTVSATAAQCGTTFVSNSTDIITLPEASTVLGCRYTFVCGTADDFDINPADGTDVIGTVVSVTGANTTTVLAPSAGDAIRCTDIGSSIMLEAVGADLWISVGASNGIFTDVN